MMFEEIPLVNILVHKQHFFLAEMALGTGFFKEEGEWAHLHKLDVTIYTHSWISKPHCVKILY